MTLSSVVLPQPEGPTTATSSPSPTLKLTRSSTGSGPLSERKVFFISWTTILTGIAPLHRLQPSQQPPQAVQQQPDQPDDDHGGDHQVIAVAGIARIDDEITQPGPESDHLGRDAEEPGAAEANPHPHDDLGQCSGDDHPAKHRGTRNTEIRSCAQVSPLDRVHPGRGLHDHRKYRRDEDQEDRRGISDAEPENG